MSADFLTPRVCRDRGYQVAIWCESCRVTVLDAIIDHGWSRHLDRELAAIWAKSGLLCRNGCGRRATGLKVTRWVGLGSQQETVLALGRAD